MQLSIARQLQQETWVAVADAACSRAHPERIHVRLPNITSVSPPPEPFQAGGSSYNWIPRLFNDGDDGPKGGGFVQPILQHLGSQP
jgi:hypothetical protein